MKLRKDGCVKTPYIKYIILLLNCFAFSEKKCHELISPGVASCRWRRPEINGDRRGRRSEAHRVVAEPVRAARTGSPQSQGGGVRVPAREARAEERAPPEIQLCVQEDPGPPPPRQAGLRVDDHRRVRRRGLGRCRPRHLAG